VHWREPTCGKIDHLCTTTIDAKEKPMSKRGRKRKARAKSNANHGKRPNA
jgi:hypothetical protein